MILLITLLKIIILIVGIIYIPLGVLLILLDARFHFFSNLSTLREQSPDWIIMNYCCSMKGLPEYLHKVMAIFLATMSVIYIILNNTGRLLNNTCIEKYNIFYRILLYITLSIIILGVFIKGIILSKTDTRVAFLL